MTTAGQSHRWMLWTFAHDYPSPSDEFVVVPEGFRVQLMGNSLELSHEGAGQSSLEAAALVAEQYAGALRKFLPSSVTLVTEKEWLERTTPPFGGVMMANFDRDQRDPRHAAAAIKAARNECLGETTDTWLRRCYDHLQAALTGTPAYEAFKAMEVLDERLAAGAKGDLRALREAIKKAKESTRGQRHIPKKGRAPVAGDPLALAREAVREYERYLLAQAS